MDLSKTLLCSKNLLFDPRTLSLEFTVEKETLEHIFPCQLSFYQCSAFIRGTDKSLGGPTSLSIFFQPREQLIDRRGQIRRIGWVIKTLEAQVGRFLLGCKCPVIRFLTGRAKDLSAPRYLFTNREMHNGNFTCYT
jgi:hypothetical protein